MPWPGGRSGPPRLSREASESLMEREKSWKSNFPKNPRERENSLKFLRLTVFRDRRTIPARDSPERQRRVFLTVGAAAADRKSFSKGVEIMLAIVVGFCAAWLGDGPSLNQPRPTLAQPTPSVVIQISGVQEQPPTATLIPPSPLPEFFVDETPQIQFEFSQIESCSDSDVHPPAPPAELEPTTRMGLDFDYGECAETGCDDEACPAPMESPKTVSQLHQLRTAIELLKAAGMPGHAEHLQEQYRTSAASLRDQLRQELATKQVELQRLEEEIRVLKSELAESDETAARAAESNRSPTIVGLQATGVLEFAAPRTDEQNAETAPIRVINPSFYVGDVPAHVQEAWNRATAPRFADRATNIAPQSYVPPAGGSRFHILRLLPADELPRMVIAPPSDTDDSGIFLQTPPSADPSPFRLIPSPRSGNRPATRFPNVLKPTPEPDLEPLLDVLPPAPLPAQGKESDDDPVT